MVPKPESVGPAERLRTVALLLLVLLLWVAPILVGSRIMSGKGRGGGIGALLGFLLGWIGVVSTLLLSDRSRPASAPGTDAIAQPMYRECPHCKEAMRRDATVCPHCRSSSPAWQPHGGYWWWKGENGVWYWLDEHTNTWRVHEAPPASEPVLLLDGSPSGKEESS